jgi:hypothetical protein
MGIFFVVHGHESDKKTGCGNFPNLLGELGYFVVTVDAYKHGLRIKEPYISGSRVDTSVEMATVVKHTIEDIVSLYNNEYRRYFPKFNILGISMGGHIAFQAPRLSSHVNIVIPIVGSPDLKGHYLLSKKPIIGDFPAKLQNLLEELEIVSKPELFKDIRLFSLNGSEDSVVFERFSIEFHHKLADLNLGKVQFKSYPCGHTVTVEMENDIVDYLKKNI